jgi:hypothetical protein
MPQLTGGDHTSPVDVPHGGLAVDWQWTGALKIQKGNLCPPHML